MIRRASLASLVAVLLCAPVAHAVSPPPSDQRPVLWKVSDADNSLYLLGSFHLLRKTDYPLPVEVDRAFDDAESLLFEVHPDELTPQAAAAVMPRYTAYSAGQSLSTVLPKASLDKLGTLLSAGGGSVQAVEQTEPWLLSIGMVLGMARQMGFEQELGVDRHLMARAAAAGKPVEGLERLDDQMRSLDAVPYAEQVQGLEEFINDPPNVARHLEVLHAAWRSGDVAALDGEMRSEMREKTPTSYQLVNVARNDAWLPRLEARLAKPGGDDTLVVVGALHLLGEDGLVERLRAKGYTVERVCDACMAAVAQ